MSVGRVKWGKVGEKNYFFLLIFVFYEIDVFLVLYVKEKVMIGLDGIS